MTPRTLALAVDRLGRSRRAALRDRLALVLTTLGQPAAPGTQERITALVAALDGAGSEMMWLTLSVLQARLPDVAAVQAAHRRARLDGPLAVLAPLLAQAPRVSSWPRVEVVTGAVLVDLHHTARTALATGIQRVARQAAVRWHRDHAPLLVGWTSDLRSLRRLSAAQERNALHGGVTELPDAPTRTVLVPWHSTYLLPELLTEPRRARAVQALLRYSHSRGAMIGFDCVPVTAAETTSPDMGGHFTLMLAAIARGQAIAAISAGAAAEYSGWRAMLGAIGDVGPEVAEIMLPIEAPVADPAATEAARRLLGVDTRPLVLCVGSHEPRKNHLAVLQAAELRWRAGDEFTLAFIGGNAWAAAEFEAAVAELQAAGRDVRLARAVSDEVLFAAYRLARCTIFPSFVEGFGLPVAESLACGTPVITSDFGSTAEIAAGGGALLVDPHDDHAIAEALRRLLTDDVLHAELSAQAAALPRTSWDDYARRTWSWLVDGVPCD